MPKDKKYYNMLTSQRQVTGVGPPSKGKAVSSKSNRTESPTKGLKISDRNRPTENTIRVRAHQIYERTGGNALDNWLEAERQIREEFQLIYNDD